MLDPEVVVRRAEPAVVAVDVLRIHQAAATAAYAHIFSEPFPHEAAARRWSTYPGTVHVAATRGTTVGFAACQGDLLDALYVLPDVARRGIGSRLLAVVPHAERLWVLTENKRGRRFYENRGWHETEEVRPAYASVMEVLYRRQPLGSGPN